MVPIECHLNHLDNDINDDDFQFDNNTSEHILVGLNTDPSVELAAIKEEKLGSDDGYCK